MEIVVTGAMGFVGINIVRELAAAGHDVTAVDMLAPDDGASRYLADVSQRVRTVVADIADDGWAASLVTHNPECLVHAAAVTPLGDAEARQAVIAADINVAGTARVLRWAADAGVSRIVHVSTGSVYGPVDGDEPVDEDADQRPDGVYGITKSAGERLARRLADLHGFAIAVVRLSHVYGPMERPSAAREIVSPIERWTRALLSGVPIAPPRADQVRDFVHVADVARAILGLLEGGLAGCTAYNVSSGVLTSETELVAHLRRIEPALRTDGPPERRASSASRPPLAIGRLATAIGWRPEIPLADGLRGYVEWRRASGL